MEKNQAVLCPVCERGTASAKTDLLKDNRIYQCVVCGEFEITYQAELKVKSLPIEDRRKISSFTRERSIHQLPIKILTESLQQSPIDQAGVSIGDILSAFPLHPSERLDRGLINLHMLSKYPGAELKLLAENDFPILFSENEDAFRFLRNALADLGWISYQQAVIFSLITVTVKGWNRIAELSQQKGDKTLRQAFVAMSFHPSMDGTFKNGIKRAAKAAGYEAIRIDFKEHNEKICDAIIADIRKSLFMVADFTGYRSGVFFEAGFALGLGMTVIWTCKEDDKERLSEHFDTRQYNHILWKDEDDLFEKLTRRINATILAK